VHNRTQKEQEVKKEFKKKNSPKSDPVRKLVVRFRDGSGSMVGIPVADVVVVHVLVDIRRRRFGGTKRFPLLNHIEIRQHQIYKSYQIVNNKNKL